MSLTFAEIAEMLSQSIAGMSTAEGLNLAFWGGLSQETFLSLPGLAPPKTSMQLRSMIIKTQLCKSSRGKIGLAFELGCHKRGIGGNEVTPPQAGA
eukprot:scaffold262480_cov14-Tisochrysis_lutea.AAC.1